MDDILFFFNEAPGAVSLYEAIRDMICSEVKDVTVKVSKTQISFSNRNMFACISLPRRRVKGWPELSIVLTFGLNRKVEHPRITESVEPYPGRWTHHIFIQSEEEVDDQIKKWLWEAYVFASEKRPRR